VELSGARARARVELRVKNILNSFNLFSKFYIFIYLVIVLLSS